MRTKWSPLPSRSRLLSTSLCRRPVKSAPAMLSRIRQRNLPAAGNAIEVPVSTRLTTLAIVLFEIRPRLSVCTVHAGVVRQMSETGERSDDRPQAAAMLTACALLARSPRPSRAEAGQVRYKSRTGDVMVVEGRLRVAKGPSSSVQAHRAASRY
ncbi:hypothetical protein NUW54_g11841 [Trametes sanguinea]|uniref:Uncharacterized protein n=1 Tax=Trametes sanguinea TaxID=158606 RepID=A0ACC1N7L1_9APHY|nr:hypothetical protein NUW54_g11841 [Trametes sanguinea]